MFIFLVQVQAILRELEFRIRFVILQKIRQSGNTPEDVEVNIDEDFEFLSDIETDSGGSDSSVSDGLPMQLLHASVPEVRCVPGKYIVEREGSAT